MHDQIERGNWKIHWKLTESAGLMVYLADYRGHRVLWEGSLPYVTIDHHHAEVSLEDDSRGSHGPFWVPLGERTLAADIRTNVFRGGFEVAADFLAGPYSYTQLWRFHDDGRIAPWLTIHRGGLHASHTYHPHWRFDFDLDGALDDAVERFEEQRWNRIEEEGWFPNTGDADQGGAVWRQIDFGSGASVSIRPHQWEDAELFAIRYHDGEWAPFSPRNEPGVQPFPAAYAGTEPLDGHDVTLWYVTHVHYDDSFPFTTGPWLRVEGF